MNSAIIRSNIEFGQFGPIKIVLFSLFFFPSITFGFSSAEIFPWVVIVGLFFIRKVTYTFLVLAFIFLCFTFSFLIISGESSLLPQVLRSLGAYINSLFAFALFVSFSRSTIYMTINLCKGIFYLLIILGFLQYLGVVEFLDPAFKFLVPRASGTSLSYMNRGVTLLSSEPARAGNVIIFLYILVRTVFIKKGWRMFADAFVSVYLLLIIQSSMALMLFMVYLIIVYNVRIIVPIILGSVFFMTVGIHSFSGRSVVLIRNLIEEKSIRDGIWLLVNTSGHRLLSIYSSFNYGIFHPLGGGIGNWVASSIEALHLTGLDLSEIRYFQVRGDSKAIGIRSSGFMSNLVLDIGIIGLLSVFWYLWRNLKKYVFLSSESRGIIWIFLLKIFFVGSVGHPVAWITTILSLRYLGDRSFFIPKRLKN